MSKGIQQIQKVRMQKEFEAGPLWNLETGKSSWGFSYSNHIVWPLHQAEILTRKVLRQGDEPGQGKSFLRWMKENSKWEITEWKKCFRAQFARLKMLYRSIILWQIWMQWISVMKKIFLSDECIQALWMKVIECIPPPPLFQTFSGGCNAMGINIAQ